MEFSPGWQDRKNYRYKVEISVQLTVVVHCFSSAIRKLVQTSSYKASDSMLLNSGLVESPEGCAEKECGFSFALGFPLLEEERLGKHYRIQVCLLYV